MATMHVNGTTLNLRREPVVRPDNVIAGLPLAHPVEVIGDAPVAGWKEVRTDLDGRSLQGFVAARLLRDAVSAPKESLIREAVAQWLRFARGAGKETEDPYFRFVGEMWRSIGLALDGRDSDQPWSAAFISFVTRRAGSEYAGFRFAAAHARYIHDSIRKRQAGTASPFWGFRLSEHRPMLGDMVCRWRVSRATFDTAAARDDFKSHCDIVVQTGDGFVNTLGGNVANSVSFTRYALTASGHLAESKNVFAVLRNNL